MNGKEILQTVFDNHKSYINSLRPAAVYSTMLILANHH